MGAYEFTEAPTLIVTISSDTTDGSDGETSLREAITFANSNADASTITFDIAGAGPHIVQLDAVLPDLSTPITINGPTDESVTVRGEGAADPYRIFTVTSGVTANIAYLTITNGSGGILNDGTLNLSHSTISGNTTALSGAGIFNGAAGTLSVSNSTISGNTSTANSGGGIANFGTLDVSYSTLSNNTAFNGGGIFNNGAAPFTLNYSIVAGNSASTNANVTGAPSGTGNVIDVDAKLGALQDNGGPTQTHALLYGSPALNAGNDAAAPATDQRGLSRPVGVSDIGAFEVQATYLIRGYVRTSDLSPVPDVSVQLSTATGAAGLPVMTDATGYFEFSGVPAGTYGVTPTKTGWSFSPVPISLTVTNGNRGVNFKATRVVSVHTVQGRIADVHGAGLPGVSVALTPGKGGVINPVTTNGAGYYTFTNVPGGNYTITPTLSGYRFSPISRSIEVIAADLLQENFVGVSGYRVHGRIADRNGVGIAGVEVLRSGSATPAITNGAGYYNFYNVPAGNYTLTPSKSGYLFTPSSRSIEVTTS